MKININTSGVISKEKKYRETISDYQEQIYGNLARDEELAQQRPTKDYDQELYN